jgi:hypothetical protein
MAGVVVFFMLVGVVLLAAFFGPALLAEKNGGADPDEDNSPSAVAAGNIITRENAQPGTLSWEIPSDKVATIQIQAYASANSVLPGQKLTLYVSTLKSGVIYAIDIYRLGWYGGYGGRLMLSVPNQIGQAQGYYDANNRHLVQCLSCHVDISTGLVEANWQPSYTFTVPADWTSGIYLAKFSDVNGWQTYAVFDVRDTSHSRYIVVTPDATYAAYNYWGGYSLYVADSLIRLDKIPRGVKVSFDRPYYDGDGASQVLRLEINAVRWLERQGYDLSYMSDIDLHSNPTLLLQHRAYISLGHDEYWTKEMRDGVEAARDQGVGLAFFGANAGYWQIRLESDSAGQPFRTVVCYKVSTPDHDLSADPMFGKDDSLVTTRWRDPLLDRPENAMVGIMYSSAYTIKPLGYRWQVDPNAKSTLLNGTALQPGQAYGCNLVGYEWDRVMNNGATPAGLQVLGTSHVIDDFNYKDTSNTTYYIARSGAMVFATGSIYWTHALDNFRLFPDPGCPGPNNEVPGMQKLLANVMNALVIKYPPQRLAFVPTNHGAPENGVAIARGTVAPLYQQINQLLCCVFLFSLPALLVRLIGKTRTGGIQRSSILPFAYKAGSRAFTREGG